MHASRPLASTSAERRTPVALIEAPVSETDACISLVRVALHVKRAALPLIHPSIGETRVCIPLVPGPVQEARVGIERMTVRFREIRAPIALVDAPVRKRPPLLTLTGALHYGIRF